MILLVFCLGVCVGVCVCGGMFPLIWFFSDVLLPNVGHSRVVCRVVVNNGGRPGHASFNVRKQYTTTTHMGCWPVSDRFRQIGHIPTCWWSAPFAPVGPGRVFPVAFLLRVCLCLCSMPWHTCWSVKSNCCIFRETGNVGWWFHWFNVVFITSLYYSYRAFVKFHLKWFTCPHSF